MKNYSDVEIKQMKLKLSEAPFWQIPLGGKKPYHVLMNGNVVAGFDEIRDAHAYVKMQTDAKRKGQPTFGAKQRWEVILDV